jgi:hypothetical protein
MINQKKISFYNLYHAIFNPVKKHIGLYSFLIHLLATLIITAKYG